MDWILTGLALFNACSMLVIYLDRNKERIISLLTQFAYSLVASELAWLWLPVQVSIAVGLSYFGALNSMLGIISLLVLVISWIPMCINIMYSFMALSRTEAALKSGLGENYFQELPSDVRDHVELQTRFKNWSRPFSMHRLGIEKLKHVAYGPLGIQQRLDVYRPKQIPEGGCPVLIQIHGGAWMIGSKSKEALPLTYLMASKGWICVSINYRLSPSISFPTHLEDCKRALHWVRTEGKEYGINPEFVAISGGSAGGHLATLMGMTENMSELQKEFPDTDTSVQAIVSFYGLYDFLARYDPENQQKLIRFLKNRVIFESPEDNPQLWDLASPITQIRPDLPPFMIVQGNIDSLTTTKGARIFYNKLKKIVRTPVVYLELPGAEHAFDNILSPRTDAVNRGVYRFLEWSRCRHTYRQETTARDVNENS